MNEIEEDWGSCALEIVLVPGHQAHLLAHLAPGTYMYQLFSQIVSIDHLLSLWSRALFCFQPSAEEFVALAVSLAFQ